jgi:hypothetical protein
MLVGFGSLMMLRPLSYFLAGALSSSLFQDGFYIEIFGVNPAIGAVFVHHLRFIDTPVIAQSKVHRLVDGFGCAPQIHLCCVLRN